MNFPAPRVAHQGSGSLLMLVICLAFLVAVVWVLVVDVPQVLAANFGGPRWGWTTGAAALAALSLASGFDLEVKHD